MTRLLSKWHANALAALLPLLPVGGAPFLPATALFAAVAATPYGDRAHIPAAAWQAVAEHLLPWDHALRRKLDALFAEAPPLDGAAALRRRGFYGVAERPSGLLLARHAKLEGWLLKFYPAGHPAGYEALLRRAAGARLIRAAIAQAGLDDAFYVPRKWLYPVPGRGGAAPAQPFILVAEALEVLPPKSNRWCWRHKLSRRQLLGLHSLVSALQLCDSVYIDNVPFIADGRLAFVDTEHWLTGPDAVQRLRRLTPFLPDALQPLWRQTLGEDHAP